MNFGIGGYDNQLAKCATEAQGIYKPRSLREQLTDRIAQHQAQIDNLKEALDSMAPEVERALNALQKL